MTRRALAMCAVVCAMVGACGHYGAPVRAERARDDAAAAADAPEPAEDAAEDRDEP